MSAGEPHHQDCGRLAAPGDEPRGRYRSRFHGRQGCDLSEDRVGLRLEEPGIRIPAKAVFVEGEQVGCRGTREASYGPTWPDKLVVKPCPSVRGERRDDRHPVSTSKTSGSTPSHIATAARVLSRAERRRLASTDTHG